MHESLDPASPQARLILVMGVAGSGKTTIGKRLAARLAYTFIDADDFHTSEAVARMRSGVPLSDEMRDEWIERVAAALAEHYRQRTNCVLAFSGLRARHRRRLMQLGFRTSAFLLSGERRLLAQRIAGRHDHFMPARQLPRQLATMEPVQASENIASVDIDAEPDAIVDALVAKLAS
ncbi:MAG TPA: gluconokinase, GntK/IdnK-type [Pseudomonadales bacterium]